MPQKMDVLVACTKWQNISHILRRRNSGTTAYKHSKSNKNTTQQTTVLENFCQAKHPLFSELSEKQANEEGNLTSIHIGMF